MRRSRDVRRTEGVGMRGGVAREFGLLRRDGGWNGVRGRGLHRERLRLRPLPSRSLCGYDDEHIKFWISLQSGSEST